MEIVAKVYDGEHMIEERTFCDTRKATLYLYRAIDTENKTGHMWPVATDSGIWIARYSDLDRAGIEELVTLAQRKLQDMR